VVKSSFPSIWIAAAFAIAILVVVGCPILYLATIYCSRVRFGGYLRERHPEEWVKMTSGNGQEITSGITDINLAVARFRMYSSEDLGDPEVHRRRKLANRLEWGSVLLFVVGVISIIGMGVLDYWMRGTRP
jgi:hypothetical protein